MAKSKSFLSSLVKPLNAELKVLKKKRDEIMKQISGLESVWSNLFGSGKSKVAAKAGKGKKRSRRKSHDLKALATEVADFIKSSEKGVMAGDIAKKFGKLAPSPKAFLKKYGINVKTKGPAKRPVYHA